MSVDVDAIQLRMIDWGGKESLITIFEGHYFDDFQPVAVFGDPGWSCETCGIWKECSRAEFRKIFGVDFEECYSYEFDGKEFSYRHMGKKKPSRVGGRISGHRRRA